MKLIRQDDEKKLLFWLMFNQFECVCYKVNLIYLVSFVKYYYISNH